MQALLAARGRRRPGNEAHGGSHGPGLLPDGPVPPDRRAQKIRTGAQSAQAAGADAARQLLQPGGAAAQGRDFAVPLAL